MILYLLLFLVHKKNLYEKLFKKEIVKYNFTNKKKVKF